MAVHSGDAGEQGELTIPSPRLTFACELDTGRLADLSADSAVVDDLLALGAPVALMCSDFKRRARGRGPAAERGRRRGGGDPVAAVGGGLLLHRRQRRLGGGLLSAMGSVDMPARAGVGRRRPGHRARRPHLPADHGRPMGAGTDAAPRLLDPARPARSRAAYRELVE